VHGLNTNLLFWGQPAQKWQSSYEFTGVTEVPAALDGTEFTLGTFTHHNYAIMEVSESARQFQANLNVTLTFDREGPSREFNLVFNHNETLNQPGPVPDEVTLPSLQSEERITIGGADYALHLTGFWQNGELVSKFISEEDSSNSADIVAQLVAVPAMIRPPAMAEDGCRIKAVFDTSTLATIVLERLNRRSMTHVVEQILAEVNDHCEKFKGNVGFGRDLDNLRGELQVVVNNLHQQTDLYVTEINNLRQQITTLEVNLPLTIQQTIQTTNIGSVMQQIDVLNAQLAIIQKAAHELDESELKQIEALLINLLQRADLSQVLQTINISVDGRVFDLRYLLEVLATVDRILNVRIQYNEITGHIAGVHFILTDKTLVIFNVRVVEQTDQRQVVYVFETSDWKGLPAQFSLVFRALPTSYMLCDKMVNAWFFDLAEQTNVVFDLCPQIDQLAQLRSPQALTAD
jgi:putative ubiquitin-RnfH superfamily antitoxin RatB of RatAB toxin-antitoxin module